jgi:hypothetical protein
MALKTNKLGHGLNHGIICQNVPTFFSYFYVGRPIIIPYKVFGFFA